MNVRKRGLALLMCICMIFTLLPFSAFADGIAEYKSGNEYTGDSYYYKDSYKFGYDSFSRNEGSQLTGLASVKVGEKVLSANSATATVGEAVKNGITISFEPGYYLYQYKIVCGDKYSCRTAAQGHATAVSDVMSGATNASYTLNVAKKDFNHSSQKSPYWLLLELRQDNTKYKVTYDWGNLTGEMGNFAVPADDKEYLVNDTVKVLAPSQEAANNAKELGYTFTGWKLGEKVYSPDESFGMPRENVTLVAQWAEVETYSVKYEYDSSAPEGAAVPVDDAKYAEGAEVTQKTPDAYPGYTFTGWTCSDADVTVGADGKFNMPAHDVVFTGTWTELPKYTLTYKWEVQDGTVLDVNEPKEETYYKGAEAKVDTVYKNPSAGGTAVRGIDGYWYTFSGWLLDDTYYAPGDSITMTQNVTLEGQWTRLYNNYTIECYWIRDKGNENEGNRLMLPVPGKSVPIGSFTLPDDDYPIIPGYTKCENQPYATIEITNDGSNVIKLYYYKNVTLKANGGEFTYNGSLKTVNGFVAKTEIGNDNNDVTDSFAPLIKAERSETEAGKYAVRFYWIDGGEEEPVINDAEQDNYANTEDIVGLTDSNGWYCVTDAIEGELIINPSTVTVTAKNYTKYVGEADPAFDATVTGTFNDDTVEYTIGREAGETTGNYKIIPTGAVEQGNYTVKYEIGTLTIKARPVTPPVIKHDLIITAGSKTGIAPVTCDEYTVEGLVNGDVVAYVKITGSQNEPGESANVASDAVIKNAAGVDVTKNYNIKYVDGVLKAIEPLNKEDHFNYIIGYTDGTVRPDADVTRAEVATIFFRLLTDEARNMYSATTSSFSDVNDGEWYTRAIATLTNAGILKGYPEGTFNPNASITRAEMATVIARFAKLDVNTRTFSDIDGHWAKDYIELAAGNGWINGYDDGTFRPNNNITRAETVTMINRVLGRQTENVSDLLPADQMTTWSDNMDTTQWFYKDMQEATNNHECERVGDSIYEKWTEKLTDIDWATYQI